MPKFLKVCVLLVGCGMPLNASYALEDDAESTKSIVTLHPGGRIAIPWENLMNAQAYNNNLNHAVYIEGFETLITPTQVFKIMPTAVLTVTHLPMGINNLNDINRALNLAQEQD